MAVFVKCDNPRGLLQKIYRAIDDNDVKTWTYDDAGDLTHSAAQWEDRAWLRPRITEQGNLVLNIVAPQGGVSTEVYAVFHGRFVEMLLAHFDKDIESARATGQATASDLL